MKIDGEFFPGRAAVQTKPSFSSLLKQPAQVALKKLPLPPTTGKPLPTVAPKQAPATALASQAHAVAARQAFSSHEKSAAALSHARSSADQHASRLEGVRAVHSQTASEHLNTRLVDLICKELTIEFTAEPAKSRVANQDLPLGPPVAAPLPQNPQPFTSSPGGAAASVDGSTRAAQAVALIERIECFVKESRQPCLALTLNNSLGAKVEIERVGPREVALKVVGHRGPPSAEDVSRIREEMRARGLKVAALSVA